MPSGVYDHHKIRGSNHSKWIPRETRICGCGCDGTFECKVNSKQKYIHGHHGNCRSSKLLPKETRVCKCGCGRTFECWAGSKQKFIRGHNRRGEKRPRGAGRKPKPREIRTCACSCEGTFECIVTSKQQFIWGHNKSRANTKGKVVVQETINKMSKNTKRLWQTPEYVAKQMRARNVCPNKAETFLDEFFQDLLPNEYKFVGDGKDEDFIIAGKCPDFVNINGQKKIIELFGEPFHAPKEEQERIDLFAQYGYQTLIIWYNELENLQAVEEKVLSFHQH